MTTLVTLPGVDILATGTWALSSGPATFTADDLENAIDAATCPSVGDPIVKLGHVDPRFDGEPAVGRVTGMKLTSSGQKITADLTLLDWLGEAASIAYPNRSIEGSRNFVCQQGHVHPFVITGLALLSVTRPGIGVLNSIEDVAALYDVAAAEPEGFGEKWRITMASTAVRRASGEEAGAIIRRSIRRGAIPANRAVHYAARALAGEDISFLDILAGSPLDAVEDPDEFMHLFPPQPGQEREWRASKLAASAPQPEDELTREEWVRLFGEEPT